MDCQGRKGTACTWWVFVRQEGRRYYIGRTARDPRCDIIWPSSLHYSECSGDAGAAQTRANQLFRQYQRLYGGKRVFWQRGGYLHEQKKDPMLCQPMPVYSYDESMVRKVSRSNP